MLFGKYPVKNDFRTKWSLLSIIQLFLKVKDSINKVLKDISLHLTCSDNEVDILSDIVAALEPVKKAAEALCRQNATLLTAEGIFKFREQTETRRFNSLYRNEE